MNEETSQERKNIDIQSLVRIALLLGGVKLDREGNILSLGINDLEQLWYTIAFLKGDKRYKCEKIK